MSSSTAPCGRRATLFVRSDLPAPSQKRCTAIKCELQELVCRGVLDDIETVEWEKRVPLQGPGNGIDGTCTTSSRTGPASPVSVSRRFSTPGSVTVRRQARNAESSSCRPSVSRSTRTTLSCRWPPLPTRAGRNQSRSVSRNSVRREPSPVTFDDCLGHVSDHSVAVLAGTRAVEGAIKLARKYTGSKEVISLEMGFARPHPRQPRIARRPPAARSRRTEPRHVPA